MTTSRFFRRDSTTLPIKLSAADKSRSKNTKDGCGAFPQAVQIRILSTIAGVAAYRALLCLNGRRLLLLTLLALNTLCAAGALANTAFYYSTTPPLAELSAYSRVVLDPRLVTDKEVATLTQRGVVVHAYVSIGEIEASDTLFNTLPDEALLTKNPAWNTHVVDLDHPAWHTLVFDQRLASLRSRGFQGAFLDTLDSYQLTADVAGQERALARLITKIQQRHPKLQLLLNRGFDVLPKLPQPVVGVVAESLFRSHNSTKGTWSEVADTDREWLLSKLHAAQAFADEIIIIDYVPKLDELAITTAKKIIAAGFTPWVTDPSLTNMGVSTLIPLPRRVLLLHNDSAKELTDRDAHTLFGGALDWLGYVADFHDMRSGPPRLIKGVHAGVMMWTTPTESAPFPWLTNWLKKTIEADFKLVLLGGMPSYSGTLMSALGLTSPALSSNPRATNIDHHTDLLGNFEAPLRLRKNNIPGLTSTSADNHPELTIRLDNNALIHPVITANWGGLVQHPYLLEDYGSGRRRFIVDPYLFLQKALGYTPRPVLDTTTESGSRLLTIHVDGDGFVSRAFLPGSPLSAEVLLAEFIKGYDLPHTISVIEGEVGEAGLYPEQHETLEALAKEIFREPNVEIASHSFSHPFFWQANLLSDDVEKKYGLHMPIPGYRYSLEREVFGSVDYINKTLAPENKKVAVFLWTGSADPDAEALRLVDQLGIVNVNGGNSGAQKSEASHTNIWPQARKEHGGLQIYAPIMNENVYTNDWTGPFYGFNKAIETIDLTDTPRRLKPISIYYHFYSATKPASIKALRDVYDDAAARDVLPLYLSEYAQRVEDYYSASIFEHIEGGWVVANLGRLRTLRIPSILGYPNLEKSPLIAGFADINTSRYLHLSAASARLQLQSQAPTKPFLVRSNAMLKHWKTTSNSEAALQLEGHVPISLTIGAASECTLTTSATTTTQPAQQGGLVTLTLQQKDTGSARLVCKSA